LFSHFPQRHVSAQRRSVVAHYREFSETGNSFFEFYFQVNIFYSFSCKNNPIWLNLRQIFSLHGDLFLNNISIDC
ncbi:hypothetical protein, partial [Xenorhabdus szentirmaii]|uniref:hypothetical protein n=1 Tax=Xenorhabdus szentirmaii TaxID=290112 RepID=UPI002B4163CE